MAVIMDLSNWLQLGNVGQVDCIIEMLSQPEWAMLTLASAVCTCLYMWRDPPYCGAFFVGFWSTFAGVFVLLLQIIPSRFINARLYYPPGMVDWDTFSVIMGAAILMLQGWLIIQKEILVFAVVSLLGLPSLIWVINASYTLYLLNRERQPPPCI